MDIGNAYSVAYYTLRNGYKNIITVPLSKESRNIVLQCLIMMNYCFPYLISP